MSSNASSAFSSALPTPASSSLPTPTPSVPGTAAGSPSLTGSELLNIPNLSLPADASSSSGQPGGASSSKDPPAIPGQAHGGGPSAPPEKRPIATKRIRWIGPEIGYVLVNAEEFKALKKKMEPWCPPGSFRFFDLPPELRIQILQHALLAEETIDLDPLNIKSIAPRLRLLEASKRMHDEASQIFYGQNVFRLFPIHGRFTHTKKILLQRLSKRYRRLITCIEMRLGPSWTDPPKTWQITPKTGLEDCINLRILKVYVQIDPSADVFKGFRISGNFYTIFCRNLLTDIAKQAPSIHAVEFDGFPSVEKFGELMTALIGAAKAKRLSIGWGRERGWGDEADLESGMKALSIWA